MNETARLYSTEILGLAVRLAEHPLNDRHDQRATARSVACGSQLSLSLARDTSGAIADLGVQVQACAIGQASAAIFATHAPGCTFDDLQRHSAAMEAWFAGGVLPEWPEFDLLSAVQPLTGRHGAVRLPWKAAIEALSSRDFHR